MDYDIEREKAKQTEIRSVFRELFPLANENDLPSAACHIKQFLRDRIEQEAIERVHHWKMGIVRVLCEISPPKTHTVDMARIVVEEAKEFRRLKPALEKLNEVTEERNRLLKALRAIGKVVGCNHTEDADGWAKLPTCVEETLEKAAAFKSYVHDRLDAMGVPVDPDSPHRAEGCRVGGRLDWIEERLPGIRGGVSPDGQPNPVV